MSFLPSARSHGLGKSWEHYFPALLFGPTGLISTLDIITSRVYAKHMDIYRGFTTTFLALGLQFIHLPSTESGYSILLRNNAG
jgi:hypothetical protein